MLDMKTTKSSHPCANCPFRKVGGVRVSPARAKEIAGYFTDGDGAIFNCHKTAGGIGDRRPKDGKQTLCVGGVAFAIKTQSPSRMTRMAIGLHVVPMPEDRDLDVVVDTWEELAPTRRRS